MNNRMKRNAIIAAVMASMVMLAGCSHTSTSETTANFTIETDEGSQEYNYSSDLSATVGTENGLEIDGNVTADTTDTAGTDESVDEAVLDAARYIDGILCDQWDDDDSDHRVTCDDDEIYVQVWNAGTSDADDLDEAQFQESVIPSWMEAVESWRAEVDGRGLSNVEICMQYVSDSSDTAFFTIEGGEVTYNVFEEY